MNPELLAEIGALLYGPQWQRPLGVALRVSFRTIQRWAAGADMPDVRAELAELCRRRATRLLEAASILTPAKETTR